MKAAVQHSINRNTERIFLLLITIVMAVMFYKIYIVINTDFSDVPARLQQGTMINLNDPHPEPKHEIVVAERPLFSR